MQKRGYFFTIDAFVAILILVMGILLVLSIQNSRPYDTQALFISQDLMTSLSSTNVRDINQPYINALRGNGTITNFDNSVMEQAAEFYVTNQDDISREFIKSALSTIVPSQYGYRVVINNEVLYNTSTPALDINVLTTSKTIVYGTLNRTILWGPYTVELTTWQQ